MVTYGLAIRSIGGWALLMAPIAALICVALRLKARRIRLRLHESPGADRELFGYRMGSYLGVLLFLVTLLFWVGLFLAVRFDWNPEDVGEIEISTLPSPDPEARPERRAHVEHGGDLSRLFDGLKSLQPYEPLGHEHAIGKSYVLRLRRRSDGRWSGYRLKICPDTESTGGGMRTRGVYKATIEAGSGRLNLGSYQAVELGRLVEELALERHPGPTA